MKQPLNAQCSCRMCALRIFLRLSVIEFADVRPALPFHVVNFSSTKLIIFDGEILSAEASLKRTRIVGWFTPRSIRLTKFLSMSAAKASCSCDSPACFLSVRSTCPKAIAGSKRFSQYIGRNLRAWRTLSLHNILVILEPRNSGPTHRAFGK